VGTELAALYVVSTVEAFLSVVAGVAGGGAWGGEGIVGVGTLTPEEG